MKRLAIAAVCGLISAGAAAYPLDGYDDTGIRRLEYYRLIVTGEIQRTPVPLGARLPLDAIEPRFPDREIDVDFGAPDAELGRAIADTLADAAPLYAVTVLDLSDPSKPVYAEHNGDVRRNVGSVGKLLVGLTWFQVLADIYPDDVEARERLMHDTWITADGFIISDHHKVVFFDPETRARSYRRIAEDDRGSLWDWIDWTLSASNNSASSTMQKQILLLKHFGRDYPPSPEQEQAFFADTSKSELGKLYLSTMEDASVRNGVDPELFRQGSFFTREGKRRVPGTNSYGNPREILKFLFGLDTGAIVDYWSSRELKRLLYMTQRRIRYASHPVLNNFAVYFKSGSLYRCKEEEGFTCGQYQGNDLNLLASTAVVEGPVGDPKFHYMVVVSSNVLRVNSAVAHQTLALRIHRLLEARHKASATENTEPPALPFDGVRLIGQPAP